MTAFGPTPIDPRGVHASLAAAQGVRGQERSKPNSDAAQRARDAAQQRVYGAESESAVRRTADEHADEDSESHRDRRDGKRDEFRHDAKGDESKPAAHEEPVQKRNTPLPPGGPPHIDVRG